MTVDSCEVPKMNTVFFRCVGILALVFEAFLLWTYARELVSGHGPEGYFIVLSVRVGVTALFLNMLGIGLIYLRRWAAVLLSIFSTFCAVLLYYQGLMMPSGGRIWLLVSCCVLLVIPLIGTIKYWNTLRSGGKWFL